MKRLSRRFLPAAAQRGVALIECLMALLIVSVGVLGLMGLEAKVMNFSVDSEDRSRAALFAGEIASHMWLNNTRAPATVAYTALLANINVQSKGGLPNGAVTVVNVAGTTNAADITITWQPPSDVAAGLTSQLTTRVVLP